MSLHKTKGEDILQQQLLGITKLHKINGMWFFAMNKFMIKWLSVLCFLFHRVINSIRSIREAHYISDGQFYFAHPIQVSVYVEGKISSLDFEFKCGKVGSQIRKMIKN